MLKRLLAWTLAGLILALVLVSVVYFRDMNRAYDRARGSSTVVPSPCGDIEYAEGGSGPAVLVIHGSGGGYDQGELLAEAALGERFRWVAPSRFGYLRSTFQQGATWDDQARAYVHLLDHLGLERVAVVALSHGGPSALVLALLHPERVSSLTLISCGVVSLGREDQAEANKKGDMLTRVFKHDLPYWFLTKLFRKQFLELMGANREVIAGLTDEQRELADKIIDYMNPVSLRAAGAAFDNKAALPGERIAAIRAPTLIFHAVDDTLQLYHNAAFAASTIPGARLVRFERGGHLLLGVEQTAVRRATYRHIMDHLGETDREPEGGWSRKNRPDGPRYRASTPPRLLSPGLRVLKTSSTSPTKLARPARTAS